jgi:ubiquinone/menaquinone biosynthesis C-methylase UbiE/uncharacterized protein YbaR (Trm112 family)
MDFIVCPICKLSLKLKILSQETIQTANSATLPGCQQYCEMISQTITSPEIRTQAYSNCKTCYNNEIIKGELSCPNHHKFLIKNGIPVLLNNSATKQRTKKTFDIEWNVFTYNEKIYGHSIEEEFIDLKKRMNIDSDFLKNKIILDAGCGIGRITQSVNQYAKEVIGIDFSSGVEEAYLLNKKNSMVHIIQGDLMNLPFRDAYFDYAYSKGVMHYVPDVQRCLNELTSVIKTDGALSITIYNKMTFLFEIFNTILRQITLYLPIKANYMISYLLTPFLILAWKWSGVKQRKIDWNERAHMIFNWLSSEFQNSTTNEEAKKWFSDRGYKNIALSKIPVGITGIKKSKIKKG